MRRALVLGGTGTVGRAVLDQLADAGVSTVFTYHQSEARARELQAAGKGQASAIDLGDTGAVRAWVDRLIESGEVPDIVIHCAAVAVPGTLASITDDAWERAQRINCQSAMIVCQALAPHWIDGDGGDVVLVGALDRTQSLPLPIAFAATQGMLSAMTMALANELGGHGIRINMVALGLLGEGLSRQVDPGLYEDFHRYSALKRDGRPEEAAKVITWVALHNEYMNGKVMPANGGI